jgi:hypothetical protein
MSEACKHCGSIHEPKDPCCDDPFYYRNLLLSKKTRPTWGDLLFDLFLKLIAYCFVAFIIFVIAVALGAGNIGQ